MQESETKVYDVLMTDIFYDEDFNCRGKIPPGEVIDLAKDIDANKLMNPILLQVWDKNPPYKYRVVCGHRRFMAFKLLKRETIPGIIKENIDQKQALVLNLSENLKRKDLNILQEARALEKFIRAGMNEFKIAEVMGMSRGWVQIRRELLTMPTEIQEAAAAGMLTAQHIRDIYSLPTEEQYAAVREIKERKLKGDKSQFFVKKKSHLNPLSKRIRKRPEIFELMTLIQDQVGNNFATRCLAWAAGEISDVDIHNDLREFALSKGITYELPATIRSAI